MIRITLLIIVSAGSLQAQEWAPIGAVWHYTQFQYADPQPDRAYLTYESIGDTLFQNRIVRILKKTLTSYNPWDDSTYIITGELMYVFEDSSRVWFYSEDTFKLLYDFSASVGDTIDVGCPGDDLTIRVVIDSVNIVQLNGQDLKRFYVHTPWLESECLYIMSGEILEKIGWTTNLFPQSLVADPANGGDLRCYSDDVLGEVRFSDLDCNYLNTPVRDLSSYPIRVYPNPTTGKVTLEDPEQLILRSVVYDALGRQVEVREASASSIDLSSMESGYYSLLIVMKNGERARTRILKVY